MIKLNFLNGKEFAGRTSVNHEYVWSVFIRKTNIRAILATGTEQARHSLAIPADPWDIESRTIQFHALDDFTAANDRR